MFWLCIHLAHSPKCLICIGKRLDKSRILTAKRNRMHSYKTASRKTALLTVALDYRLSLRNAETKAC